MKRTVHELAIYGGPPAFEMPLHVGRPNIGNKANFLRRASELLDRRWLTNDGPFVRELELSLAEYIGVRHCVTACNGTIALELAIRALGLNGEVIVPSFTFIATAHALQWQRLTPVFCDIDPSTHNIDPQKLDALISEKTTGIIGVHVWGRPCDIDALERFAGEHDLKLIFDAAHAFGCSYKGHKIGGFGDAEVFSFHATKIFNTFEGGCICTNNDDLADRLRLMRNFGFAGYDRVVYPGTNGKMQEISAAMGLTLLEEMDRLVEVNRQHYRQYKDEMGSLAGLVQVRYDESECGNYQYIVFEVMDDAPLNRDRLLRVLHAENIIARRYFYPGCHRMEPYASMSEYQTVSLPQTDQLARRVLVLPTGTAIGEQEISQVAHIIRLAMEHAEAVSAVLNEEES